MASTKPRQALYSSTLDSMASFVANFASDLPATMLDDLVWNPLDIFFLNYPKEFVEEFSQKLGMPRRSPKMQFDLNEEPGLESFVEDICDVDGEPVFLLRDAQQLFDHVKTRSHRGLGMPVNRSYLCRSETEEDYFTLINLIYNALNRSNDLGGFLDQYHENFSELVISDKHFMERSRSIAEYILNHIHDKKIIWIDLGFQFTFVLFCLASVEYHCRGRFLQDFKCYTTYPWLQSRFQGNYYRPFDRKVLELENIGIQTYTDRILDRAAGALVGFAVGDALGFPGAGIDSSEIGQFIEVPITGFGKNNHHPLLGSLSAGDFTSNTEQLLFSGNQVLNDQGFTLGGYALAFAKWGAKRLSGDVPERWIGPSSRIALERLIEGVSPELAGSNSESCSCLYRCIPLALASYQDIYKEKDKHLEDVDQLVNITHSSIASRLGSQLYVLILADLVVGTEPRIAVKSSVSTLKKQNEHSLLLRLVESAEQNFEVWSDSQAMSYFGTGSPMSQTLPLAIFYFLKYSQDFAKAVLAGANSFRHDTTQERVALSALTWQEQLVAAKGGNTDGIAALVGGLVGTTVGFLGIPKVFKSVEGQDELVELGRNLVTSHALP